MCNFKFSDPSDTSIDIKGHSCIFCCKLLLRISKFLANQNLHVYILRNQSWMEETFKKKIIQAKKSQNNFIDELYKGHYSLL